MGFDVPPVSGQDKTDGFDDVGFVFDQKNSLPHSIGLPSGRWQPVPPHVYRQCLLNCQNPSATIDGSRRAAHSLSGQIRQLTPTSRTTLPPIAPALSAPSPALSRPSE